MTCPASRRIIQKLAAAALLAASATGATAQTSGSEIAVPFYRPEDVVAGLYQHWARPRAAAFTDTSEKLQLALASFCGNATGNQADGLAEVREAWKVAVADWERLSAVPFGPLIERRSVRAIDFTPPRPALIERAIKHVPRDAAGMERVGSPAKGFPALEWLLWTKPVDRGTQACAYAVQVAADIAREAGALSEGYAKADPAEWEAEKNAEAFTEFVNQWVGSAERLRWQEIERPLREAKSASRAAARFPRAASAATSTAWKTHWTALANLRYPPSGSRPRNRGVPSFPLSCICVDRGRRDWRTAGARPSARLTRQCGN